MVSLKTLNKILLISHNEIFLVILYGSMVSVLSLIVPLAAQRLVTIVSFGTIQQPLFVLSIILFALLSLAAMFQVMQTITVENIQQRIFTNFALSLAKNILNLKLSVFDKYRGTELANRFFDIFILKKALAQILLSGVGVLLQVIFGLILLGVYHPLLLLFAAFFAAALILSIWLPWKSGINTAIKESSAKYEVARWLEELARLSSFFKFNNHDQYAYNLADEKIASYLLCRQKHFKVILLHTGIALIIQIFASALLLLLGGILIIKNQLSLGQLVAAEIVVNALGNSVTKLGKYLENIYDFCASADKVSFLFALSVENQGAFVNAQSPKCLIHTPPNIKAVKVNCIIDNKHILNDVSLNISSNEKVALFGGSGSGKSLLIQILLGLQEPTSGDVLYNNISLKNYDLYELRKKIFYINNITFFDGSIIDNLRMNNPHVDDVEIFALLEKMMLTEQIENLQQGIKTELLGSQNSLSISTLQKLMFVGAALSRNHVLILDHALDDQPIDSIKLILNLIYSNNNHWTVIATTRRLEIATLFDRYISL